MMPGFRFRHVADVTQPIIVLRPVHQANIAGIRARREIPAIGDAAVKPQPAIGMVVFVFRIERVRPWGEPDWVAHCPAQQFAGPRWRERRHVIAPELVFRGPVDGVVFTRAVIHCKTIRECLNVGRTGFRGCVRLARLPRRLRADHILHASKRQQIALFGGIEKVRSRDGSLAAVV